MIINDKEYVLRARIYTDSQYNDHKLDTAYGIRFDDLTVENFYCDGPKSLLEHLQRESIKPYQQEFFEVYIAEVVDGKAVNEIAVDDDSVVEWWLRKSIDEVYELICEALGVTTESVFGVGTYKYRGVGFTPFLEICRKNDPDMDQTERYEFSCYADLIGFANSHCEEYPDHYIAFGLKGTWDDCSKDVCWISSDYYTEFPECRLEMLETAMKKCIDGIMEDAVTPNYRLDNSLAFVYDKIRYKGQRPRRKDLSYVCPACIREAENCVCSAKPKYVMKLDTEIVPILRALNIKGYHTSCSCAGHIDEKNKCIDNGTYVSFSRCYGFSLPLPDAFFYDRFVGTVYLTQSAKDQFTELSFDEGKKLHAEHIKCLTKWAEALPENKYAAGK